jgi:alpha-ribazole phosphatase
VLRVTPAIETRLYLIRHGETPRPGFCNGHLDVTLTSNGVSEMEDLASRLSHEGIAAVYASDLSRSLHSAEILGAVIGRKPITAPMLREKCFGQWEGLTQAEIQRQFPTEWTEWIANPANAKPTGGESCRELAIRVLPVIDDIVKRHRGERVAIVAHGGVNRVILCHVLGLDLRYMERIAQKHGAVNIIEFLENDVIVRLVNG